MADKITLADALNKAKEISKKVTEESKVLAEKTAVKTKEAVDASKPVVKKAGEVALDAKDKSVELAIKGKEELVKVFDQNGNGEIDINDIIILGLKTPGVRIKRDDFLGKELYKLYPEETINKAISTTPAIAGIKDEDIDKISEEVIKTERNIVSGISAALGAPGGAAMLATIPADITQYYGCMLRAAQKMLYLYGFPEIDVDGNGDTIDSETLNILTLCLGVMYGVAGANTAIKSMAKALATGVEKKLINTALTKGTIYPIVKEVAKWFGKKMTKEVFAGFFKKAIPVVGGVIGGGITFVSFKPCCDKLKASLKDTMLSNPNRSKDADIDIVDIDVNVINEEPKEIE